MRYRRQLRSRIIVSFLLFGVGLTGLFAATTLVMREWLEDELIEGTLQAEVDKTAELTRKNPEQARFVPFQSVRGWTFGRHQYANVPFEWRKYETGVYDVESDEAGEQRSYKLAVNKSDDYWLFLEYDVTQQRRTRTALTLALFAAVGVFAAFSLGLAFWLSRREHADRGEQRERQRAARAALLGDVVLQEAPEVVRAPHRELVVADLAGARVGFLSLIHI